MNNSRLQGIQNWPQFADATGYSVKGLAKSCKVSVRALERLFLHAVGDTPRRCLKRRRMQRAVELLRDGSNVNETADRLGYHDRSHFSREFKKCYGLPPKTYAGPPSEAAPKPKMSHSATELSHLATNM